MKNLLFSILLVGACLPAAAQPIASASSDHPFYLEVGVVNDFPFQSGSGYNFGAGGQAALGYALDPDLSIQLTLADLYYNNLIAGTENDIRVCPELKLYATLGDIRPYLIGGAGIDFQQLNGTLSTSWIEEGGLGLDWDLKSNVDLFVEAKWNWVAANAQVNLQAIGQDIVLVWGFRFGL